MVRGTPAVKLLLAPDALLVRRLACLALEHLSSITLHHAAPRISTMRASMKGATLPTTMSIWQTCNPVAPTENDQCSYAI